MKAVGPTPEWNLPNLLTLARVALVPMLGWLLYTSRGEVYSTAATAVFVIAAMTDFVDGNLARKRGLITAFGELWDPIADKALTGMALIGLSALHEVPWWVTITIMTREIGITWMRFAVIDDGVVPASRGGKVKTTVQMVALIMMLMSPAVAVWLPGSFAATWHNTAVAAVFLALAVTVATGIDYIVGWRRRVADLGTAS